MVDKCRSGCGNIQSVLDVNREILMKTSDIRNLGNAYRSIYEAKTKEEEVSDNKDFKPHMMYDPETGKGYKAEKPEDHERMSKMGYTHEEPDMVKEKKLPRQMLDPKKDVMVVKNNKVIVVDKSKEAEYLKKGWGLAEQVDEEESVSEEVGTSGTRQSGPITLSKERKAKLVKVFDSLKVGDTVKIKFKRGGFEKQIPIRKKEILRTRNRGWTRITFGDGVYLYKDPKEGRVVYAHGRMPAEVMDMIKESLDEKMKFGKRLKVDDIVYVDDGGKGVEGKIHKIIGKHDRDSGTFEVKLKSGKVVKKNLDQMTADADIMEAKGEYAPIEEAVSPAQQAAIAISKKEKEEEMKNEGSVKDLAIKIDRVVAKMNKDSKLKAHAKKFASMAMDTMDIEKSLEKSLPSSVSGAVMIGLLEKKQNEALDPVDPKAVDKKFKDRKDKDIDNDGDVDDSDEYLHNRRAKVDDAIDAKKKEKKENAKPKKKKLKASADANFEPMSDVAKSPNTAEIEKIGEEFIAMLEAALKSDGKDKDGKDLSKKAIDDEEYHEKEPKKGKDFIAKHKKSDKSLEDKESEASATATNDDPMGKTKKSDIGTKPKSGKRPQDDNSGDTNIVKSTEAPIKEGTYENPLAGKGYPAQENKEEPIPSIAVMAQKHLSGEGDKMDLVQMAVKHMNGEKVDFTKKAEKIKNPYDGRMKLAREFMKRMDKRRGIEASVKTPKVETAVAPQETLNKNGEK